MKKVFATLMVVMMSLFVAPSTLAFTDVPTNDWFTDAVSSLSDKAVVMGFEDDTFKPGNNVTRAEVVVMLDRLLTYLDKNAAVTGAAGFSDVPLSEWFGEAASSLLDKAVVMGYEDNTFRPGNNVTRAELVVLLDRLLTYLESNDAAAAANTFTDVPTNDWFTEAVSSLSDKVVVMGYEDNTFRPGNNVTRAELVVMLDRLLAYLDLTAPVVPELLNCVEDFDCFIEASSTCAESDVVNTATINFFGIEQTTSSYYKINGLENDKCSFFIRTESIDLVFPEGTDQTTIDEQNAIYDLLEGREGVCLFETSDLNALLSEWNVGNASTEDWDVAQCTGEYFNPEL